MPDNYTQGDDQATSRETVFSRKQRQAAIGATDSSQEVDPNAPTRRNNYTTDPNTRRWTQPPGGRKSPSNPDY